MWHVKVLSGLLLSMPTRVPFTIAIFSVLAHLRKNIIFLFYTIYMHIFVLKVVLALDTKNGTGLRKVSNYISLKLGITVHLL